MTRARDLADSADKDIAGTLTLDGLTVGTDNTGFGVSHSTATNTATNLTFYTTNGSAIAVLEFTHSGHGLSVGSLVNVGSSSVTSWLTTWGIFDLTSIADEVEVTDTTSTTFRVNITCTSVQTSSVSLGQGGSYTYYKGTTTVNSGKTVIDGGNVGIGVTNPDRALHVGSSTYPQIRMVEPGVDTYDIGVTSSLLKIGKAGASTNAIFLNDAGNVGIGTGSPAHKLHVADAITPEVIVEDTTNGVKAVLGADNSVGRIGTDTNHPVTFRTNDTERMRIDSSGRVGIGTTSPYVGGVTGNGSLNVLHSTAGQWVMQGRADVVNANGLFIRAGDSSSDTTALFTGRNEANVHMKITGDGNVGIGTTSPLTQTHIQASTVINDDTGLLLVENTNTTSGAAATNSGINIKNYHGTSQFMQWEEFGLRIGNRIVTNSGSGHVIFTAGSDSEKMRITSSGNVGIGTSNPTYKLHVDGEVQVPASINYGSGNEYGSGFQINGNKLIHVHASSSGGQSNQHHGSGVWLNGSLVFNCGRSWGLVVISGGGSNKGKILHSQTYDVYNSGTNATSMVNDMATYHTNGNILIVTTNDEPDNNGSSIRTTLESTYGAKYAGGVKNSRYAYAYAWRHGRGTLGEQHSMYVAGTVWTASGYNNSRSIASITFTALV